MFTLQVDGIKYENFVSISVAKSIEALSGTFNFTATLSPGDEFPFKRGQFVQVFLNNTPVITGYINKILIRYSDTDHTVQIIGRDKTQDLIDSHLPQNFKFNGPVSFKAVIEETISRLGISDLSVVNEVDDLENFSGTDVINGKQGQTAFEFLETYARKLNVILSSNGEGNVVITRASILSLNGSLRLGSGSNNNNILTGNVVYDDSNRYNKYITKSQGNFSSALIENDPDSAFTTNQSGEAVDTDIREGRIFTLISESASDNSSTINRALWEANLRRANSIKYVVTVSGFFTDSSENAFWKINRLVQVQDVIAGINSNMLINSATYTTDNANGSMTRLELITPDAYQVQPELPKNQTLANDLGDEFND